MSKTMQFCKTSSVFELNLTTSKREHFCETSFKNGKLSADLMASYQRVLRFPEKKCHQVIRQAATATQKSFDAPKCNLSQEISALTS